MNIGSVLGAYQAQQIANAQVKKQQETAEVQAQQKTVETKPIDDQNAWMSKYDPRNITPSNFIDLTNKMHENGLIGYKEQGIMLLSTFKFAKNEAGELVHIGQKTDTPMNFYDLYKNSASSQNDSMANLFSNILNAFDRVIATQQTQRIDERV